MSEDLPPVGSYATERIVRCPYGFNGHAVRAKDAIEWSHAGPICKAHAEVLGDLLRDRPYGREQHGEPRRAG